MARTGKTKIEKRQKPAKVKTRKKRKGLKAFFSIVIILAAAGAVFWFGWVQFRIGEGQVGVVYTKSHGYEDEALVNGEFNWRWQALLPTNLTLHVFDIRTRNVTMSRDGTLPSGNLYAAMAGADVEFDWRIRAKVSYRIRPEMIPGMVASGQAVDGMDSFYEEYEAQIEGELSRMLAGDAFTYEDRSLEETIESLEADLTRRIADIDGGVEVLEAVILDWSAPDMDLYAESRRLYLDFMKSRQAVLAEVEDSALRREDLQGARLGLLEEYGRILADYPVLLDLFTLEGNPGASLLPPAEIE